MNKNLQTLMLVTGALVVAVFGLARVTVWANFGSARPTLAENTRPNAAATLDEIAKDYGHLTITFHPRPLRRYDDVKTLFHDSTSVIVGMVNDIRSELTTPKRNSIATRYRINVNTVLKGSVQTGTVVTALFPGGALEFDNGTRAEVLRPKYWKVPELNNSYVFFLNEAKDKPGVFEVVGGPQGFFKVSAKGQVVPQSRPDDLLMRRYYKMNLKSFLEEAAKVEISN